LKIFDHEERIEALEDEAKRQLKKNIELSIKIRELDKTLNAIVESKNAHESKSRKWFTSAA